MYEEQLESTQTRVQTMGLYGMAADIFLENSTKETVQYILDIFPDVGSLWTPALQVCAVCMCVSICSWIDFRVFLERGERSWHKK